MSRRFLVAEVALAGMATPPAAVRELFETFLRQLSLPRLVHFLDLVLPQLVAGGKPVQAKPDQG